MRKSNRSFRGVGITGLLFIVSLVLKLTGVIAWSWWWVTSPLWIPLIIVVVLMTIIGIIAAIAYD